jgi:hypothetical protein
MVTESGECNMEQEPQKKAVPEPPATPPSTTEEPAQVIRPEDEAKVVERLRELGYID